MAFWKKSDEKKEEIQRLKEQVESRKELPKPPELPPQFRKEPEPETPAPAPREIQREAPVYEERPKPSFAPLFVKIERYREVLDRLEEIKGSMNSLKELIELLVQVDDIRREGMGMLKEAVGKLMDTIIALDEEFVRPEGAEGEIIRQPTAESAVKSYVSDLQAELKQLRKELSKLD